MIKWNFIYQETLLKILTPICVLSHRVVDEVVVLFVFGNIDKMSTSGSLISVAMRL